MRQNPVVRYALLECDRRRASDVTAPEGSLLFLRLCHRLMTSEKGNIPNSVALCDPVKLRPADLAYLRGSVASRYIKVVR